MKTYQCFVQPAEGPLCAVSGRRPTFWLPPRRDLLKSPAVGFNWGSCDAGGSLLAVSILADHFAAGGSASGLADGMAICLSRSFLYSLISEQKAEGFSITTDEIRRTLAFGREGHEEPLAITIAAVFARDMRTRGGIPKAQRMPSFEVVRVRYLAALISGLGCSPHSAERILEIAHARDLYNSLSQSTSD